MRRSVFTQKCLCLFLGMSASLSVTAAPYDVIDLGTLGGDFNYSYSINNLNQVVGYANGELVPIEDITEDSDVQTCVNGSIISIRTFCDHAYFFESGVITDLGTLDGETSYAFAINDSSTTVGFSAKIIDNGDPDTVNPLTPLGFVSYNSGTVEQLRLPSVTDGLPEGVLPEQRALDINNNDQIVGITLIPLSEEGSEAIFPVVRPFIYDLMTDTYTIVPVFSNEFNRAGAARAINENGLITGWANSEDSDLNNPINSLLWDPATPEFSINIGTLGGFTSEAYDINDNNIIVGLSDTSRDFFENETVAYYYDIATDTMSKIPEFSTIDEFKNSQALAINNMDQVVGTAQSSANFNTVNSAFLYQVGEDSIINLNDMIECDNGWNLVQARDINDAGYITGTGTLNGEVRSFMLVPTSDTTPTNCTQVGTGDPDDPDDPDNGDSSSSSMGYIALLLAGFVWLRRRYSH